MENHAIIYPRQQYRFRRAIDLLRDEKSSFGSYLEIGAGLGMFARRIRPFVTDVSLLDFSKEAIAFLQKNWNKDATLIASDFMTYSFTRNYDLIVMFEVLEHLQNDQAALEKIHSLLTDDGVFLFSVPAHMWMWSLTDEVAGHYRRYEREELVQLLHRSGFEVRKCISYGFPLLNGVALFRNLFFAYHHHRVSPMKQISSKEKLSEESGLGYNESLPARRLVKLMIQIFFHPWIVRWYARILKPLERYDKGDGYLCLVRKTRATH